MSKNPNRPNPNNREPNRDKKMNQSNQAWDQESQASSQFSSKETQQKYAKLIARAWSDESFKQRLRTNPTQALKEFGLHTPPNAYCEVVENTTNKVYLVIPKKPSEQLSEEEMRQIIAAQGLGFQQNY
ncbi:MAG: NHLP leader peptide family RiPP precursor [Verrucomicrobiota bacterium]|nr:NHLP leader peptide family RiPP precursor [Verrucomicrobiota bacterium]